MGTDKATRSVLRKLAKEPALTRGSTDINEVRAAYDRVFSSWTATPTKPTREDWVKVEGDQHSANVMIVEPANRKAIDGTIIFIHGGGWSLGTVFCYAPMCRILAGESNLRVVAPDFPQAPEHPYPAALNVLLEVSQWVDEKFSGPLLLAGDSAGGALAAVLSADQSVIKSVAGQALLYPVLDLRLDASYKSRRRFGSGKFFLQEAGILGAAAWYCGEGGDATSPRISAILEPALNRLPPTFMMIPDLDPLRDEGEHYAKLLKQHAVDVDLFRAKNTIHGCASFSRYIPQGLDGLKSAAQFLAECAGRH